MGTHSTTAAQGEETPASVHCREESFLMVGVAENWKELSGRRSALFSGTSVGCRWSDFLGRGFGRLGDGLYDLLFSFKAPGGQTPSGRDRTVNVFGLWVLGSLLHCEAEAAVHNTHQQALLQSDLGNGIWPAGYSSPAPVLGI